MVVIPATMAGRPAGVQIVGPNHGELACLQLGAAYDEASRWVERRRPALA